MKKPLFLMWRFSESADFKQSIQDAIERYQNRYGCKPNRAMINRDMDPQRRMVAEELFDLVTDDRSVFSRSEIWIAYCEGVQNIAAQQI